MKAGMIKMADIGNKLRRLASEEKVGLMIGFFRVNVSPNSGILFCGLLILCSYFAEGILRITLGKAVYYLDWFLYAYLPYLNWSGNTGMPSPVYGLGVLFSLMLAGGLGSVIGFCRKDLK